MQKVLFCPCKWSFEPVRGIGLDDLRAVCECLATLFGGLRGSTAHAAHCSASGLTRMFHGLRRSVRTATCGLALLGLPHATSNCLARVFDTLADSAFDSLLGACQCRLCGIGERRSALLDFFLCARWDVIIEEKLSNFVQIDRLMHSTAS